MSSSNTETEIKIAVSTFSPIRRLLLGLAFRRSRPRLFEQNELFDAAGATLRAQGCLLRLRRIGRRSILTFKGPATSGRHKVREELETAVSSEQQIRSILERLGYSSSFRYEKYRTEYSDGRGLVTFDETPIGNYIELEGPARWIDQTARRLGFSDRDYITKSYGRLYLENCARNGTKPGNMTFPTAK